VKEHQAVFLNKVGSISLHVPPKASFALAELAAILGVSDGAIRLWIKKGLLPAYGKPMRIKREDLMKFIGMGSGR
jgi:excisionase family DNA binding protein